MGLFGYGKKDFERNTRLFIDRLQKIYDSCADPDYMGRIQDPTALDVRTNCRTMVNKATRMFHAYPEDASGKEIQRVDERVSYLIGLMERDVREKNVTMLTMHAGILFETLDTARRFGKEDKTPEQLKAEEIVAESLAQTREYLGKIIEVSDKQKTLEEEAQNYSDEDPRFSVIDQEYTRLEEELKKYRAYLAEAQANYRENQSMLDLDEDEKEGDRLKAVKTPQEVDRQIMRLNQKRERRAAAREAVHSSISDYKKERDASLPQEPVSTLRAKRAAEEASKLGEQIDGSSVPTGGTPKSALRSKLGR